MKGFYYLLLCKTLLFPNRLVKGDPAAFLPIISYCFTSFSTCIAELLVKCDVELTAKSDLRFIEAVYKVSHHVLCKRNMGWRTTSQKINVYYELCYKVKVFGNECEF